MNTMETISKTLKAKKIIEKMLEECANDMIAIGVPVQKNRIKSIFLNKLKDTSGVCYFETDEENKLVFRIAIVLS